MNASFVGYSDIQVGEVVNPSAAMDPLRRGGVG